MASGESLLQFFAKSSEDGGVAAFATFDARGGTSGKFAILDFDAAADESIDFVAVMPQNYGGGGVTVHAWWMASTATSGNVVWQAAFREFPQDAEDMLQEALVVLWERVRAGKFEYTAQLGTFIFATVKNMWLRQLARLRREVPSERDPDTNPANGVSPLEMMIEDEQALLVREALDKLGEPCRKLLLLFYWEELSMVQIAEQLGFANAETAKSKKYQCKKSLEKLLKEYREAL